MIDYNSDNIIAKILRAEIPCNKVFEDEHTIAIRDIAPKAPSHVLVIPKGAYQTHDDFMSKASEAEILAFQHAIAAVVAHERLAEDGYRLVMNNGTNGGQEIPHLHCHILGGTKLRIAMN